MQNSARILPTGVVDFYRIARTSHVTALRSVFSDFKFLSTGKIDAGNAAGIKVTDENGA